MPTNTIAQQNIKIVAQDIEKAKKQISSLEKLVDKQGTAVVKANERIKRSSDKAGKSTNVLQGNFRKAAQSAAVLEGPLGNVAGRLSSIGTLFGTNNPLIAAGSIVLAAFTARTVFAAKALSDFESQQGKVAGVLSATGFAAGKSAEDIESFAQSLARSTLASTEGVRNASVALASFTNIVGDNFERTLEQAQNISASFGGDIVTATKALGQALEDPINGLDRLRRSGVSFNEEQKKTIKNLAASGQLFKAQEEILNRLEGQVGGSGQGANQGLKGAFDSLGQSLDNYLVSVGKGSGVIAAFTGQVESLAGALQKAAGIESLPIEEQKAAIELRIQELELERKIAQETSTAFIGRVRSQLELNQAKTKLIDIESKIFIASERSRLATEAAEKKAADAAEERRKLALSSERANLDKLRVEYFKATGQFERAEKLKTTLNDREIDKRLSKIIGVSDEELRVLGDNLKKQARLVNEAQKQSQASNILSQVTKQNEQAQIQALRGAGKFVEAEEAKYRELLRLDQERLESLKRQGVETEEIEKQFAKRAIALESQKAQAIMKIRQDAVDAVSVPDFSQVFELAFDVDAGGVAEIEQRLLSIPDFKKVLIETELIKTDIDFSDIPERIDVDIPVTADLDTVEGVKEALLAIPEFKETLINVGLGEQFNFDSLNVPESYNIPVNTDITTVEQLKESLLSIPKVKDVLVNVGLGQEFDFSSIEFPESIDIPVMTDLATIEGLKEALLSIPDFKETLINVGLGETFDFDSLNIPEAFNIPVSTEITGVEQLKESLLSIPKIKEVLVNVGLGQEFDFSSIEFPESVDIPVTADLATVEGFKEALLSIPDFKETLVNVGLGETFDFNSLNIPEAFNIPVTTEITTVEQLKESLLSIPSVKEVLVNIGVGQEFDFSSLEFPDSVDIPVNADFTSVTQLQDALLQIPEVKDVLVNVGLGETFDFSSLNLPNMVDIPVMADFQTVEEFKVALLEVPELKSVLLEVGVAQESIEPPDLSAFLPSDDGENALSKQLSGYRAFTQTIAQIELEQTERLAQIQLDREETLAAIRAEQREGLLATQDLEAQEQINREAQIQTALTESAFKGASDRVKAEANASRQLINMRKNVVSQSLSLLGNLTSGNEKVGKAILVAQAAVSASMAIINSQVAATRALAELGPVAGPPVAAKMILFGKISAALIAANAVASLAAGGSTPSVGASSFSAPEPVNDPQTFQPETATTDVNVVIDGAIDPSGARRIIEAVGEQLGDGFNFNVSAA